MRIMVAEDDAITRKLIQGVLERAGHEVAAFEDAADLITRFEQDPVPLIVTDWMMPRMSGVELCARIRDMVGIPYTHIILITTLSPSEHTLKAFNSGVDDFVSKPIDGNTLVARVAAAERSLTRQEETSLRLALESAQSALGPDHRGLSELLGNMASFYRKQQAYTRCRAFLRRQLAIAKRDEWSEEIGRIEGELSALDDMVEAV